MTCDRRAKPKRGGLRLALICALAISAALAGGDPVVRAETPATPQPPADEPIPDRGQIRSFTAEQRDLSPEDFRQAFEEKTIHLSSGMTHYGSEYYLPGDRSVWIGGDGPCRLGAWTYENAKFCFRYAGDGPYCWRVFESGGDYFAESIDGLILRIYAVEQKPLQCDPELLSAL